MNTEHVNEEALQAYAMDRRSCDAVVADHIEHCPACKIAADNYRLLFSLAADLPDAAPEFDTVQLVMPKLKERKWFDWAPAAIVAVTVAVTFFLFGAYGKYLLGNVRGLPLYLALAVTAVVILLQVIKMMKNFRRSCNLITGGLSA